MGGADDVGADAAGRIHRRGDEEHLVPDRLDDAPTGLHGAGPGCRLEPGEGQVLRAQADRMGPARGTDQVDEAEGNDLDRTVDGVVGDLLSPVAGPVRSPLDPLEVVHDHLPQDGGHRGEGGGGGLGHLGPGQLVGPFTDHPRAELGEERARPRPRRCSWPRRRAPA